MNIDYIEFGMNSANSHIIYSNYIQKNIICSIVSKTVYTDRFYLPDQFSIKDFEPYYDKWVKDFLNVCLLPNHPFILINHNLKSAQITIST